MSKKSLTITIILISLVILVPVITYISTKLRNNTQTDGNNDDTVIVVATAEYDYNDLDDTWDSSTATEIDLNTYTGTIQITQSGTYHITGTLQDGNIYVKTDDTKDVKIVLDNVNITSSSTAPIYIENANKVVILLAEGSTNYLEDSSDMTTDTEGEPDGVIFSKDDLTINGTGNLIITANYADGIVSKDDLKIINGNITITSADDGIRGKDSVTIKDGTFNIIAKGDGIKSTNDTDTEKGNVIIENGTFNITATMDAIQTEQSLTITDGTFNLVSGNGKSTVSSTDSMKALKCTNTISIEGGTFTINSLDDAIHSNNAIVINGGSYIINTGDDGIHADTSIIINDGDIDIQKSYEGIESSNIEINNAEISIIASDDGINIAGGNDQSAMGGRPGQNTYNTNADQYLTINSGNIYVNSVGDGLDANGSIYMNGGTVIIDGPTDNGNGALDYDGVFNITGGTLISAGSSGMLQTPSTTSTQYSVSVVSSQSANTTITVKDSSGNEIISYTPTKTFASIVISTPEIKKGESYTIYAGNTAITTLTISNMVTSYGNGGGMGGNQMQMGGGRR